MEGSPHPSHPAAISQLSASGIASVSSSPCLPPRITSRLDSAQSWVEDRKASMTSAKQHAEPTQRRWNTSALTSRIGVDFTSACASGGLVAPVITIIDKAIIENAAQKHTILQSAKQSLITLLTRPHNFIFSRPFALIFALYSGTYLSANLLDTAASTVKNRNASSVTSGTSKFLTTSAANLSLCLYKDSHFTKIFGAASSAPRKMPPISMGLFAVRDMCTVFASFNLPPLIAPLLPVGQDFEKYMSRASCAQFLAPAAVQVMSTPLHLLGLDLYNRPSNITTAQRIQRVVRDWPASCAARICRIVPAFGLGGVVNTGVRKNLMQKLD